MIQRGHNWLSLAVCAGFIGAPNCIASAQHQTLDLKAMLQWTTKPKPIKPSKENKSEEDLSQASEAIFTEVQREKIEALPETDALGIKKTALQLQKKNTEKSKDWRDKLTADEKLTEDEIKAALAFVDEEYENDAENYDLRQMKELLEESLELLEKSKIAEAEKKKKAEEAFSALSNFGKDVAEKLGQIQSEVSRGWDGLSDTEKLAAEVAARVSANSLLPGAGALIPSLTSGVASSPSSRTAKPADSKLADSKPTAQQIPKPSTPLSHSGDAASGATARAGAASTVSQIPSTSANGKAGAGTTTGSTTATSTVANSASATTPADAPSTTAKVSNGPSDTNARDFSADSVTGPNTADAAQAATAASKGITGQKSQPSNSLSPASRSAPSTETTTAAKKTLPSISEGRNRQPVSTASAEPGSNNSLPSWQPNSMQDILQNSTLSPGGVSRLGSTIDTRHNGGQTPNKGNSDRNSDDSKPWSSAIGDSNISPFNETTAQRAPTDAKASIQVTSLRSNSKSQGGNKDRKTASIPPNEAPQTSSGYSEQSQAFAANDLYTSEASTGAPSSGSWDNSGWGNKTVTPPGSSRAAASADPQDSKDWNSVSASSGIETALASRSPVGNGNRLQMLDNTEASGELTSQGIQNAAVGRIQSLLDSMDFPRSNNSEVRANGWDWALELGNRGLGLQGRIGEVSALSNPNQTDYKELQSESGGELESGSALIDENFIPLTLGYNVTADLLDLVREQSQLKKKTPKALQSQLAKLAKHPGNEKRDLGRWIQAAKNPTN
jgi:hypothetical protein